MTKSIYSKLLIFTLFILATFQLNAACNWSNVNTNWSYAVKGGVITVGLTSNNNPCIQTSWSLAGSTYVKGAYTTFTVTKNGSYKICMKLVDTCKKCDTVVCKEVKVDGLSPCAWYKINTNWSYSVSAGKINVGLNMANYPCVQQFWSLSGGTAVKASYTSFTVTKNGTYVVCMKLYDTCKKCDTTICKEIKVDGIKSCNVDFTATITRDGVKFKPIFPCNGKAVYSWKFGNGTSSNNFDPFVTYKKGTYEVCLTAKCYTYDQNTKKYDSCESKICKKIVIKESPCELKGEFSFKIGEKGEIVLVGSANETNVIYYWTIDNNTVLKGRDVKTTLKPGVHTICLTIYNQKTNCKITICKTIEIPTPKDCKVDFTATVSRDGAKFKPEFKCNGTASYSWNFGNGTTGNTFDPFVQYKKGTYEVCLTARCSTYNKTTNKYEVCEAKICKKVVIKESPCELKGDFEFKIGEKGEVVFVGNSNQTNSVYEWTIDGKSYYKGRDFKMTLSPGAHKICLTIYNQKTNCKITICKTIEIKETPKCNLPTGWSQSNVCASYSFDGYKVTQNNTIITNPCHKYSWSFGDGIYANGKTVKHEYTKNGTYTVCMKVIDTCLKCDTVICKTIKIDCLSSKCVLPTGWSQSNTCASYNFDGYKVTQNNTIFTNPCHKYSWSFGDGKYANGKTVKHEYTQNGTYTVCMKVIDTCLKCDTMICKTITVTKCCNPNMHAEFSDTIKLGGLVRFVNLSSNGAYYKWLFGDGTSSADKNITHTYANAGTYKVCLIVYDSTKNCTDTLCKYIQVTIKRSSTAGTESISNNAMQLYPNPVSDEVTISGIEFLSGDMITIKDITGKIVQVVNVSEHSQSINIKLGNIVPGIYTIECQTTGGQTISSKLIKQ